MCGLCGSVGFGDLSRAEEMAETIAHRGPDDSGALDFPEERVSLGFRRLSIIDLSPAGHQPFSSENEQLVVMLNGEIYNFSELRNELTRKGRKFRSKTDTEVILRQYEEEGISSVSRLNGMFSIAILDRRRGKLFLVRDRLGIKPLYYFEGGGKFAFASEIKAILASGLPMPDIDLQALSDYFTYLYVPCPATIFEGIRQVPPAHVLELDVANMNTSLWPYWDLADALPPATTPDEERERLRELLADSVRRQMVSDVPLGIFLSGGIDSSILTGLMAQAGTRPVETFTVVFEGKELEFYDERDNARAVAGRFGAEHHEIPVRIDDPMAMLDLVRFFDQPFGNPTFYLMRLISEATRSEATVALCGAGGDELFAGYPRYRAQMMARRLGWIPTPLMRAAGSALSPLSDGFKTMTLRRARGLLLGWDDDPVRRFVNWTYFLTDPRKRALLSGPRMNDGRAFEPSERVVRGLLGESRLPDPGNRMLEADLRSFLLDNLLEYTDKMSMSVGLEVRVPYLDERVVAHAMRIPFDRKLKGGRTKIVLKEAFGDLLPPGVLTGQKKGFNVPLGLWMKSSLDSYFDRFMSPADVAGQGFFDWEEIQRLRAEHRRGRRDNSYELFSILMFDVWYRRYIQGEEAVAPSELSSL